MFCKTSVAWLISTMVSAEDTVTLLQSKRTSMSVESASDWFHRFGESPDETLQEFVNLPQGKQRYLVQQLSSFDGRRLSKAIEAMPYSRKEKLAMTIRRIPLFAGTEQSPDEWVSALQDSEGSLEGALSDKSFDEAIDNTVFDKASQRRRLYSKIPIPGVGAGSPSTQYPDGHAASTGKFVDLERDGVKYNISYDSYDNPYIKSGKPALFLMHGRSANTEHVVELGMELGCMGYRTIAFSYREHGDRQVGESGPVVEEAWDGTSIWGAGDDGCTNTGNLDYAHDMYKLKELTTFDIDQMINNLDQVGLPADTKVAVSGISVGSSAAMYAFANLPRIDVQASFVGSADFTAYMQNKYEKLPACWRERHPWSQVFNSTLQAKVAQHDPVNRLDHFGGRPFFVASGGADDSSPAAYNQALMDALRDDGYYTGADASKLELSVAPGGGHHPFPPFVGWNTAQRMPFYEFLWKHLPINQLVGNPIADASYQIKSAVEIKWTLSDAESSKDVHPKMYECACHNYKQEWKVRARSDSLFAVQNEATGRFLCTSSKVQKDGSRKVWASKQEIESCLWDISDTGAGLVKLINQQFSGRLLIHSASLDTFRPWHRVRVVDDSFSSSAVGANRDLFTFHGMD